MNVHQVFYGRGPWGYEILATSAPDTINREVERVCQSFGNPGCEEAEGDNPALFQAFFDCYVLMGCGRKGPPDSLGRGTLFYHVIVASAQELRNRGISAVDLYRAGFFKSSCPQHPVASFDLPLQTFEAVPRSECGQIEFPAVVRVSRSENLKLIELLGSTCASSRWATLSWERLDGFDVYGLDKSRDLSLVPSTVNIYDLHGKRLSIQRSDSRTPVSDNARDQNSRVVPKAPKCKHVHGVAWCILLIISFCVGVVVGRQWGDRAQESTIESTVDDKSFSALETVLNDVGLKRASQKDRSGDFSAAVRQLQEFLEKQKKKTRKEGTLK